MATRSYDVVITERVLTHYRVQASNGQEAAFLVGKVDPNAEEVVFPEGVELIRQRVAGTKVATSPTLTDDQHTFPLDVDDEHPMGTAEVADGLVQQLRDAEASNSGETVVGSPPQKRAAR